MRKLDLGLAGLLVLLGCIHNFVAAPMSYHRLTTQSLWFVSAGLALWYAGFSDILRVHANAGGRLLLWLCVVTAGRRTWQRWRATRAPFRRAAGVATTVSAPSSPADRATPRGE